jgi:hypothetical protein
MATTATIDALAGQFTQQVRPAEHRRAIHPTAPQLGVAVEESLDQVFAGLLEDVQHDPAVAARSENNDIHSAHLRRPAPTIAGRSC